MDKDRIAGSAKGLGGKVEAGVGEAVGDSNTQAAGQVREAVGKVQELYGQAKDAARDAADTAVSYVGGDGVEAVERLVNRNPIGALLSAAAVGFAFAMLMRPAPRPKRRRYFYYE
ncbi:MAG: CsbD family protein [Bradyrhizobium sp.]|uniref:CsbD family protein n=1 Tax=Bradyrhizobium sp. TaxID=376 RepID=UPI001DD6E0E0|nr:CsbD family protein [Bradyrhizobium sp.]MBV9561410.1 CsbD family protein [Bradyrhizobium sp.]